MKPFEKPIKIREEFFYEVLLPYLYPNPDDKGWDIEVSTADSSVWVELKALEDPTGKAYTASQASRLILELHRKARLAPFYVYSYIGTYHQATDGAWRVDAAPDMESAEKLARFLAASPGMATVQVYRDTQAWTPAEGSGEQLEFPKQLARGLELVGLRPYKVRFLQIEDYRDVALWESDHFLFDYAVLALGFLRDEMHGVGSVYVRMSQV